MIRQINREKVLVLLKTAYIFLLGFFLCQDIFTVFSYGSTSFNISFFWIIPGIVFVLIKRRKRIPEYVFNLPSFFIMFLGSLFISCLIGLFYIQSFDNALTIFKSLIYFFIASFCPLIAGFLFCDNKYLFYGLFFGFVLNFVLSFFAFLSFSFIGFPLTLKDLFVNNYFYSPNYFFRSQGLFLEPSYMTCFILVYFYILFWFFKNKIIRLLLEIMALFLFLTSGSGNFAVFLISQIVMVVFIFKNGGFLRFKNLFFKTKTSRTIFAISIVTICLGLIAIAVFPLRNKMLSFLDGINPTSKENSERFVGMQLGLLLFLKNPWGVGFGMSGTLLLRLYGDNTNGSTYNYLIKVMAEQGLLGVILLLGFFGTVVYHLDKKKYNNESFLLLISVFAVFIVSFLTGSFGPASWAAIGLFFAVTKHNNSFKVIMNKRAKKEHFYTVEI